MYRFFMGKMGLMFGAAAILLAAVVTMAVITSRTSPIGDDLTAMNGAMEELLKQPKTTDSGSGKSTKSGAATTGQNDTTKAGSATPNSSISPSGQKGETASSGAHVSDGETAGGKVTSGAESQAAKDSPQSSGQPGNTAAGTKESAGPQTSSGSGEGALEAALKGIDLNEAGDDKLDELPGIGQSKAKAIVAYRKEHGRFRTVDDLLNVKGIGPKMLEKLRPLVFVKE